MFAASKVDLVCLVSYKRFFPFSFASLYSHSHNHHSFLLMCLRIPSLPQCPEDWAAGECLKKRRMERRRWNTLAGVSKKEKNMPSMLIFYRLFYFSFLFLFSFSFLPSFLLSLSFFFFLFLFLSICPDVFPFDSLSRYLIRVSASATHQQYEYCFVDSRVPICPRHIPIKNWTLRWIIS